MSHLPLSTQKPEAPKQPLIEDANRHPAGREKPNKSHRGPTKTAKIKRKGTPTESPNIAPKSAMRDGSRQVGPESTHT